MRNILLASDLTARSDRAMSRACRLALEHGARLTVVHAIEDVPWLDERRHVPSWRDRLPAWKRLDALKEAAASEIRSLVDPSIALEMVVEEGKAPEIVCRTVERERFDLVVTGVARDAGRGRVVLGSSVEQLLRRAAEPVLVVKRRCPGPYRNVVAATDLTPASEPALRALRGLCPSADIGVMHAFESEYEGFGQREQDPAYVEALQATRDFIARVLGEAPGTVHAIVEAGSPNSLLNSYAADRGVDLTAIGTHGRTGLLARLMGSVAERLLLSTPSDVLVAPARP